MEPLGDQDDSWHQLQVGYRPPFGEFDELGVSAADSPSPWQRFLEHPEVRQLKWSEAVRRIERLVRDHGTISWMATGSGDAARPWKVDPVVWPWSQGQWEKLADGLRQRARLLNRLLLDLYGPQRLLSEALIPPELLFAHPGYLPSFHGLMHEGTTALHCYSAELARNRQGHWHVVADRTDAPLGMGYALENRVVLSRVYPQAFQDCHVQRHAPFFIAMRRLLAEQSPWSAPNPRIAIWTQGPDTPGYFEDVYLARYLGYALVESADLTVRNRRVMLKTLGGLLPVDVLVRRFSDQFCDPLELQSDPRWGVAGLIEAVRGGNVRVINSLGSSLVESAVFFPFLDRICQAWTGMPLQLPSIPTQWLDSPKPLIHWEPTAPKIASAYRVGRTRAASSPEVESWGHVELLARQMPRKYVAQQKISRSVIPSCREGWIEAMPVALRVFLVADGHGDYHVMPGGVARVAGSLELLERDSLGGEISKDVWVCAQSTQPPVTLLSATLPSQASRRRAGSELTSRVADNLLWLGRYVERIDGSSRLLRTTLQRSFGETNASEVPEWPGLIRQLANRGLVDPGYAVPELAASLPLLAPKLKQFHADQLPWQPLLSDIANIRRIASMLRDRLSQDAWHTLGRLDRSAHADHHPDPVDRDSIDRLNTIVHDVSAFFGMVAESMTRTLAWRSLDLGRRLERAIGMAAVVHQLTAQELPIPAEWEAMIDASDCLLTYRARYLAAWSFEGVLDLLVTDDTNPRSIAYQLEWIVEHVRQLAEACELPDEEEGMQLAEAMQREIQSLTPHQLAHADRSWQHGSLHLWSGSLMSRLHQLFHLINAQYLIHAQATRPQGT